MGSGLLLMENVGVPWSVILFLAATKVCHGGVIGCKDRERPADVLSNLNGERVIC